MRHGLPALIVIACLAALPSAATGQPAERQIVVIPAIDTERKLTRADRLKAKRPYQKALSAHRKGDIKAMTKAAEEVFKLYPTAKTARFLGDVYEKGENQCGAFESFAAMSDLDPSPTDQVQAVLDMARVGALCGHGMGWAVFFISPPDASKKAKIKVSGVEVPIGRTVGLAAQRHPLHIEAEGYMPYKIKITVGSGEEEAAEYDLTPLPGYKPPPEKEDGAGAGGDAERGEDKKAEDKKGDKKKSGDKKGGDKKGKAE